jgi:hypothetical protein
MIKVVCAKFFRRSSVKNNAFFLFQSPEKFGKSQVQSGGQKLKNALFSTFDLLIVTYKFFRRSKA